MSAKPNYIREWGTVCTDGDTDTLPIQMVTYLNVNFVYQEVYDMADLDFSIFLLTDVSSLVKSVLSPLTTGLLYVPCETYSYREMFDLRTCHVHPVLQFLMRSGCTYH